jgi:hypothetical protein
MSHIVMGDDHIDTVISHIISPYPISHIPYRLGGQIGYLTTIAVSIRSFDHKCAALPCRLGTCKSKPKLLNTQVTAPLTAPTPSRQGLTLVHISAQHEPPPNTPFKRATQSLRAPPIPQKVLMLSRKLDECKPLPLG